MEIKIIESIGLSKFEYIISQDEFNKYQKWCADREKNHSKEVEEQNRKLQEERFRRENSYGLRIDLEPARDIRDVEIVLNTTFYAYLMESK